MKALFAILSVLSLSCQSQTAIKEIMLLPKALKENSAIEITQNPEMYWTIQDSGNEPLLYGMNKNGNIIRTIRILGVVNNDWEELSSDNDGNIYIGDTGNNSNKRKDQSILLISSKDLVTENAAVSERTSFYFPEQKEFPPQKSERFYDVEAFFYHGGNFYLFTKNRSTKKSGSTFIYRVPAKNGRFAAKLLGKIKTCEQYNHCAITAADMSPDGTKIALLSGSKVWLLTGYKSDDFGSANVRVIDLNSFTQKEGLCFFDNERIYITDEREGESGGRMYELNLSEAKP